MSSKLINDINKYTSSDSILVHTKSRGLIRLYCPFKVKVIQAVDTFTIGQELEVVKVKVSPKLKLIYIIDGKGYYHFHFSIQA